jgi:hypothetical protein
MNRLFFRMKFSVKISLIMTALVFMMFLRLTDFKDPLNDPLADVNIVNDPEPIKRLVVDDSLSEADYVFILSRLTELHSQVKSMQFESHLEKYVLYDLSAKQALMDLANFLFETRKSLPLSKNLVDYEIQAGDSPNICLGIVTARRPGAPFSYLLQAVSSILNRMNHVVKSPNNIFIHIFNVDNEPDMHSEVDIAKFFLPVTTLKEPVPDAETIPAGVTIDRHINENLDNAAIIRLFHKKDCRIPIIIEDDSIATTNWVDAVLRAAEQISAKVQSRQLSDSSWFMTRLFVARQHYPPQKPDGINDYDPMFNTVALYFNRHYMLDAAKELEQSVKDAIAKHEYDQEHPLDVKHKDLVIADYARKRGAKMLSYEPVIFQHTGIFSSVSKREQDVESVNNWIMASRLFDADGVPIQFDRNLWETAPENGSIVT